MMNYERIDLLLRVFHAALDVNNTTNIRRAIMEELQKHNEAKLPQPIQPELPLKIEGKRL